MYACNNMRDMSAPIAAAVDLKLKPTRTSVQHSFGFVTATQNTIRYAGRMVAKRQSPSCNSQRYTVEVAVYDFFFLRRVIDCQAQLSSTVGTIFTSCTLKRPSPVEPL
ncbi:hypothetical protein QTP88_009865 [Uroleucon formosanum]